MRRALVTIAAFAAAAVGATFALGASDSNGKTYKIVLDSAFGLVSGADFKVAGVSVGSISDLDVERETARALVTVTVAQDTAGFGGLRESAECVVNPQSLIGEYFVDCQPGEDGPLLDSGATIPVEQTRSPIPPDLVLNVMRQPIAERFRIIFGELGVGFAARGGDVNETIRRAIPALDTTNTVLEILAEKRATLASLSRESGEVLSVLGRRREDVGDFVVQARDAAAATAVRRAELSETFARFPGFLDQLEPTMRDLGTATRLQAPALADLRAAAPAVTSLLDTLRPFSQAARPAVTSLGEASVAGRTAAEEAASLVDAARALGSVSAEPANNLDIILDHLDDRSFAVEPDPDSPTGAGYTGLEAPLQYIFDQTLALNLFDQRGYTLKLDLTFDECSAYTTAAEVNASTANRATYDRCNQNLGPNQSGITAPDDSAAEAAPDRRRRRGGRGGREAEPVPTAAPTVPGAPTPSTTPVPTDAPTEPLSPLEPVQDIIESLPEVELPPVPEVPTAPTQDLLDFLLG